MQLDSGLGSTEVSPRKYRQSQIYRRRIQGIHRLLNIDDQLFVLIKLSGNSDQMLGKVGIDAPVTDFVGVSQSGFGYLASNPHPVEFTVLGTQASYNIPQTFTVGHLSKCHDSELFQAVEMLNAEIALIAINAPMEGFQRHDLHNLGENHLA